MKTLSSRLIRPEIPILIVAIILLGSGCSIDRRVAFFANTEPGHAEIQITGDDHEGWNLDYNKMKMYKTVTDADMKRGRIDIPQLQFRVEGYLTATYGPTYIDLSKIRDWPSLYWHNTDVIHLERDLSYQGSTANPNLIDLTINSEPYGARIYEDGKLICTAPCTFHYTLEPRHYKNGQLVASPIIAVKEGHLPQTQNLSFKVKEDWKWDRGRRFEFATLFILPTDPNYREPQQTQGDYNITIEKKESPLDQILKAAQLYSISKSLQSK